jgi:plasmid maintenance system antidote protein VapI
MDLQHALLECMDVFSVDTTGLAKLLCVEESTVSDLLSGEQSMTEDLAYKLETTTYIPAKAWMKFSTEVEDA